MQEDLTINRRVPIHPAVNYALLREEGISRIRELASAIWTDHNTHDPGITILEVLCYAITDLGYRAGFPVEDLLASDPGNKSGTSADFFPAFEVFPNHPFTVTDFRKVLTDLPGVRNAYIHLLEGAEHKLFFDNEKEQLTYDTTPEEVFPRGLLRALVELDPYGPEGDLNLNMLTARVSIPTVTGQKSFGLEMSFPWFDELEPHWSHDPVPDKVTETLTPLPDEEGQLNHYMAKLKVRFSTPQLTSQLFVKVRILAGKQEISGHKSKIETAIRQHLKDHAEGSLVQAFIRRAGIIRKQLDVVGGTLRSMRNLGEEFAGVKPVRIEEVAVAGQIEVPLDTDPEAFLARALFDIRNHVDPPVVFHSLRSLLEKGLSPEDIFDGPLMKHGFILTEELVTMKGREALFVSDLLQVLMDTEGGKATAVKGLKARSFISNEARTAWNPNCLNFEDPATFKPRLSLTKSALLISKRDIIHKPDMARVEELFNELVIASEPDKDVEAARSLAVPAGVDRNASHYTSIQSELPAVYGTGIEGLPEQASMTRKAQARQLKGYLLFFDQLFAQYLAQLSNLKNLFSIDPAVGRTYFQQAVYQVPGAMMLMKEFIEAQPDLDDAEAIELAWKAFKADPANAYMTALGNMTETEELFRSRRNRFLDHLLARFGEEFTDYSLLRTAANQQKIPAELIGEKVAFLCGLPLLGRDRAKAFDLQAGKEGSWDTMNVTGLQKRVSHLLGFSDCSRRCLTHGDFSFIEFYQEKDTDLLDEYRFRIRDEEGRILLSGTRAFKVLDDGYDVVEQVLESGKAPGNYQVRTAENGWFHFVLVNDIGDLLARRIDLFETLPEVQAEIGATQSFMSGHFEGVHDEPGEGMHVVEHILLRPVVREYIDGKKAEDTLMPVVRDDFGELTPQGHDPYSFRITVVFPAGLKIFADEGFRSHAERVLRLETPAHIMPQVYFVDNIPLSRFERAFKKWLETRAVISPIDPAELDDHKRLLSEAHHDLLAAMQFIPVLPEI
jgi:hypothetical protein